MTINVQSEDLAMLKINHAKAFSIYLKCFTL